MDAKKKMPHGISFDSLSLVEGAGRDAAMMAPHIPPHSIEAEQSVLGSIMLDANALVKVVDFLRPRDFYRKTHQTVYEGMIEIFERGEPIDLLSITNKLKEKNVLEHVGGAAYLTGLVNTVGTPTHINHYAKIVQRKRILRDLITASHDITELGRHESEDVEDLLDQAEQRIFSITQDMMKQDFKPVKSILEGAYERIERLHQGDGSLRGIPTGFTGLDSMLAGFQRSDLIILAARPSLGKTSLALDIARHVARNQKLPVGIFSLEMASEQIVDRMIASEARVDSWKLRTGRLSYDGEPNDFQRIAEALDTLAQMPIYIEDSAVITTLQIRAMARRLNAQAGGLGLIVVDYLQLVHEPARGNSDSMVNQVTRISRGLKSLAKELNVPVLALSQLSRAVEHRTGARVPKLADLRESGSIEQDADVVMFIYREDRDVETTDRKNIADIIVAKHRNGAIGKVELYFDEARASFQNIAKEEGYQQ